MIRRAAAILLALTLNPALLYAQGNDTVLTVSVQSADVHQGPSTVTPVLGHAPRGAVLTVSRNLGSWAQIPWPDAPDGIAYVHVTMGRLGAASANTPAASPSPRTSYASAPAQSPAPTTTAPRTPASAGDRTAVTGPQGGTPISHIVGVGGMVGSMSSFGATARTWRKNRLGIQVGVTRDVMTSDATAGRVTAMQIEPGVVYALFDRVRDYVWVRPYVGSALSFRHQTLTVPATDPMEPTSDNGVGFRVFGGGELTFASVTRLGLSAEVGYRRLPTPFPGFEPDRMSVSIAGHWYVK